MYGSRQGLFRHRDQRGSILLQVLVAMSVLGFLFYTLSSKVISYRTQVVSSSDIFEIEQAMHSLMDYITYGVQQKWCFSSSWINDLNCDLAHPRSVERLLMTSEVHEFAKNMIGSGRYSGSYATPLPLQEIEGLVVFSQLTDRHPLRFIADEIRNSKVHGIRIRIRRAPATLSPVRGREMMIQIGLDLVDANERVLSNGASSLSLYSDIGVYPREVGSYALLVANDLRLDKGHTLNPPLGDFHIPVGDKSGSAAGVQFMSPVFVNRDIHLPQGSGFAPVSFAEQVTLGSGVVKQSGGAYQPSSAGHLSDQLWTQSDNFRGFYKGVGIDGSRDAGLDYLSGRLTGSLADDSLMKQCIHRNLARTDLKVTADSYLVAQPLSSDSTGKNFKASYRLAFSQTTYGNYLQPFVNEFRVQDVKPGIKDYSDRPNKSRWGDKNGKYLNEINFEGNAKPVAEVTLDIGDFEVDAIIGYNGTLEFELDMDPENKKEGVAKDVDEKKKEQDEKQRQVAGIDRDIQQIEDREQRKESDKTDTQAAIKDLEQKLADLPEEDKGKSKERGLQEDLERERDRLSDLTKEIKDLERQRDWKELELSSVKRDLESVTKDLEKNEEKLSHIQALLDQPPVVKLAASPYYFEGDGQPQFLEISLEVQNQSSLQTLDRKPLDVSLHVEGFDVGYFKTYNQRQSSRTRSADAFRSGYLHFVNAGTELTAPAYLSKTRDGLTAPRVGLTTPPTTFNFAKLGKNCDGSLDGNLSGVDWSYSFAPAARHSWNFANPVDGTFNLSDTNARVDGGTKTAVFHIRSIVKTCLIQASANFVSGFFTCDRLIIESRSEPLTIIGTIIASHGSIHPDAVNAGIEWMTIYHPSATDALRHAGVLSGTNCNSMNLPIWHPHPSLPELSQMFKCNPISLRERAEPFMWTAVDPDCGVLPGGIHTTCKRYLSRFEVKNFVRQRRQRF